MTDTTFTTWKKTGRVLTLTEEKNNPGAEPVKDNGLQTFHINNFLFDGLAGDPLCRPPLSDRFQGFYTTVGSSRCDFGTIFRRKLWKTRAGK